jgi:hypothetical protein
MLLLPAKYVLWTQLCTCERDIRWDLGRSDPFDWRYCLGLFCLWCASKLKISFWCLLGIGRFTDFFCVEGITFTIYVQCLFILIPQFRRPSCVVSSCRSTRNWTAFHIVYCTALLCLVTVGTAANARLSQLIWINNRNYPNGPLAFISNKTHLTAMIWGWSSYTLAAWLQDAYVVSVRTANCKVVIRYNLAGR